MNKDRFRGIANIIIGCVSVCLAIACYVADTGDTEREMAYGGDAYTGIQNAGAVTANNAKCIAQIVSLGFGSILLISGCLAINSGISCLIMPIEVKKQKDDTEANRTSMPSSVSASSSISNPAPEGSSTELVASLQTPPSGNPYFESESNQLTRQ